MKTPDIYKLAPTLSAEERYRLILPDFHRMLTGEEPLLSESEREAITSFESEDRAAWEEYTHSICMLQWADILWTRDIEAEKLRIFSSYLLLTKELDRIIAEADLLMSGKERDEGYVKLGEYARMFETNSIDFYALREAITQIEGELYDMPLFNEKKRKITDDCYESIDMLFEDYNRRIDVICESKVLRKLLEPIVREKKKYVVRKPTPGKEVVDRLIDEIREIADGETRMLGR